MKAKIFNHIIPEIADWPVAKISAERTDFILRLNKFVVDQLVENHKEDILELINKTIYMENQRIKLTPWKVDPADEKSYWKSIGTDVEMLSQRSDREEEVLEILKRIVNRYNEEIVGNFMPGTFKFSRIFLTSFFKRIFSKYFGANKWRWGSKRDLQEKIVTTGNIELIRNLFKKGTVVILPTHYSNLDSIMVGYTIDANVGIPSFSYGAGLNLYNTEILAYFMNRLGAFRVDRRKKNPIYLECLKSMTGYSILEGVNCIFFPGGTRSRSGHTEDKLKLGLIGSVIEAQRLHLVNQSSKKVFIVPLNLGYHFVLEASHLIDQHLQSVGKEKYIRSRNLDPSLGNIMKFVKDLYTKESEVYMSFGDPLDVFGNTVDEDGISYDKFGNEVNIKDYFTIDGAVTENNQREGVYAKHLGERIVESYKHFNVILSSNIVAFVAMHSIFEEYKDSGLMFLMNQKNQKFTIDPTKFEVLVKSLVSILKERANRKEIILSGEKWNHIPDLIRQGIHKLGIYHARSVLKIDKEGKIQCEDIKLLYFYHNRLANYNLETEMGWKKI